MTECLTDAHNMAVLGMTQTGKSSFCRELQATSPRLSIWVNEPGDDRVPDVEGKVVRSLEGLRDAMANDEWKIEVVVEDRREFLPKLRRFLWSVAEATDRDLPMQVIVDEFQRVAEQSQKPFGNLPPRDAVRRFAKEGVKRNIKFIGITQDPTAVDAQTLRQSRYRVVFDMSHENRRSSAMKDMGIDWTIVDSSDEHTAAVFNHRADCLIEAAKAEARFA